MTTALDTMTTAVQEYRPTERRSQYEVRLAQLTPSIAVLHDWEIEPLQMVLRLGSLPKGWDRSGSPPPHRLALDAAILTIAIAGRLDIEDLGTPSVFPVPGGGVQLEWRAGDRRLEIEFLPDGSAQFVTGVDGDPRDEGDVPIWPPTKLRSLLSWILAGT